MVLVATVWFSSLILCWGGIVQLVKHPTENPGAILTQAQFPGAARDFSPRVNFQCRLSGLMAFAQPQCAVTCINIYMCMC